MRYFAIAAPEKRGPVIPFAMADEDALGRVIADTLRQYIVGACKLTVYEVSAETFAAFKRAPGAVGV